MGYLTTSTFFVREAEAEYGSGDPSPLDDDSLDELGHEIAVLSAHIEAATSRLLEMIARFDEARGWHRSGFRSCAEWLAHRTGIDRGAARERVRAARALRELPLTSQALARGELTFSKVRALTRIAEPETEAHLLELAQGCTAAQVESMVRGWRLGSLKEEADREEWRFRNRSFSVFPDLDGSYVVKGRLTPEVGALLMRAIETASDHLYRKETAEEEEYGTSARGFETEAQAEGRKVRDTEAAAARRRADALALLVERGMTVGLGEVGSDGQALDAPVEEPTTLQEGENDVANVGPRDTRPSREDRNQSQSEEGAESLVSAEPSEGPGSPQCDSGGESRDGRAQRGQPRSARPSQTPNTGVAGGQVFSGTSAERYQVMVHVDLATLKEPHPLHRISHGSRKRARKTRLDQIIEEARARGLVREEGEGSRGMLSGGGSFAGACGCGGGACGGTEQDRHSHIEDIRVSAETSRRLTCDASVVPVVSGNQPTLNLGRRTRTIPPALRRALEVRDRGCRFPGCGSRFADAHHVRHWADGGETSLGNCILLCRHHHRLVHEGGWRVELRDDGRTMFFDPRGGTHFQGQWKPPSLGGDPVAALRDANLRELPGE